MTAALLIFQMMSALQPLDPDATPGIPVLISEFGDEMTPEEKVRLDEVRRRYGAAVKLANRRVEMSQRGILTSFALRYELTLFAVGRGADAARDAATYFKELRPCYEWETGAECPEREALFAEAQIESGSRSFGHVLPLMAAHLWTCAAEFGSTQNAAERAKKMFALAATSDDPLARAAARVLQKRRTCYSKRLRP